MPESSDGANDTWIQTYACKLQKAVLNVQVVGEKERENKTVNVRTRDNVRHGEHKLADVLEVLRKERAERSLESCFGHKVAQAPSNGVAENGMAKKQAA